MANSCKRMSFYSHFKNNMEGLGLPAPENLFGSISTATATAATILTQIDKFGRAVTLSEIIGAGTALEKLGVIGALLASFYAGAVIGSLAVASARRIECEVSAAEVIQFSVHAKLNRPWLKDVLHEWPGIYNKQIIDRRMYVYQSRLA